MVRYNMLGNVVFMICYPMLSIIAASCKYV